MRFLFVLFIATAFMTAGCQSKNKIRKEILTKANDDMNTLVDKAINAHTGGLGSILVDNVMSPEKKQQIIDEYLLPKFRTFVEHTEDMDSLKRMNTEDTFRYKMVLKSTVGNASEEALKALYEKIVSGGFNINIK